MYLLYFKVAFFRFQTHGLFLVLWARVILCVCYLWWKFQLLNTSSFIDKCSKVLIYFSKLWASQKFVTLEHQTCSMLVFLGLILLIFWHILFLQKAFSSFSDFEYCSKLTYYDQKVWRFKPEYQRNFFSHSFCISWDIKPWITFKFSFFLTLNIVVQNLNFNKMLLSSIESTT